MEEMEVLSKSEAKGAIHQYPYQHWNIVQYMSVQSTAQSLHPLEAEIKVVNVLSSKAKFGKDKCEHNLFNKFQFPKEYQRNATMVVKSHHIFSNWVLNCNDCRSIAMIE